MKKRFISLLLAGLMILAILPMLVGAEGESEPILKISISQTATLSTTGNGEVSVDVNLDENPGALNNSASGIVSATIPVAWNSNVLILTGVSNYNNAIGSGWCGADIPEDGLTTGTYFLAWNNDTMCDEEEDGTKSEYSYRGTGRLCTLTFKLKDGAEVKAGEEIPVRIVQVGDEAALFTIMSWYMDDFMESLADTEREMADGKITVVDGVPGDLDNNGEVDVDDAILLMMYAFFPENYFIISGADPDLNMDDEVDVDDAILLMMYAFFPENYPLYTPAG